SFCVRLNELAREIGFIELFNELGNRIRRYSSCAHIEISGVHTAEDANLRLHFYDLTPNDKLERLKLIPLEQFSRLQFKEVKGDGSFVVLAENRETQKEEKIVLF
ncbi:MAG: hypothetical protein ACRC5C_02875, partial [Bacilli bacterium]